MMYSATASATPEFTIALLMAKAQAIVIKDIHDIYFGIFTGRKDFRPRHYNGRNGHEEEHIQLNIRKSLFHRRQFANCSSGYHQNQQGKGKPTFAVTCNRLPYPYRWQASRRQKILPTSAQKESSAITTKVSPSRKYSFSKSCT